MKKEDEFKQYIESTLEKIIESENTKSSNDDYKGSSNDDYKGKRFTAACMAMQGLIMTGKYTENGTYNHVIGRLSFELADELLRVENIQ